MNTNDFDFLILHISTKSDDIQTRYYDIVESLQFAVEIKSTSKIDFEFNNMMDLMDDMECDDVDKLFDIWREVVNYISVKETKQL